MRDVMIFFILLGVIATCSTRKDDNELITSAIENGRINYELAVVTYIADHRGKCSQLYREDFDVIDSIYNTLKYTPMTTKTTTSLHTVVKMAFDRQTDDVLSPKDWDTGYRDLGVDSLGHAELIMDVEKELNINIPDDVAGELTTPNKVLKYLESL